MKHCNKKWLVMVFIVALMATLGTLAFGLSEQPTENDDPPQTSGPLTSGSPGAPGLPEAPVRYPFRLEGGSFDYAVSNQFGQWWGGLMSLSYSPSNRVTASASFTTQNRPGQIEKLFTLDTLVNWSKWFYTQIGASGGGPDDPTSFFPRYRYDANGFFKVPMMPTLVLDGGYTRLQFGTPVAGRIARAGAIYYWRKFVFQGNLNFNNVRPGNHKSRSVSTAVQYGQEGHYWVGLTAGGGREAWETLALTPQDVQYTSYSTSMFFRKWFSRHYGMVFSYNYAVKRAAYRIDGVDVRFFFDF